MSFKSFNYELFLYFTGFLLLWIQSEAQASAGFTENDFAALQSSVDMNPVSQPTFVKTNEFIQSIVPIIQSRTTEFSVADYRSLNSDVVSSQAISAVTDTYVSSDLTESELVPSDVSLYPRNQLTNIRNTSNNFSENNNIGIHSRTREYSQLDYDVNSVSTSTQSDSSDSVTQTNVYAVTYGMDQSPDDFSRASESYSSPSEPSRISTEITHSTVDDLSKVTKLQDWIGVSSSSNEFVKNDLDTTLEAETGRSSPSSDEVTYPTSDSITEESVTDRLTTKSVVVNSSWSSEETTTTYDVSTSITETTVESTTSCVPVPGQTTLVLNLTDATEESVVVSWNVETNCVDETDFLYLVSWFNTRTNESDSFETNLTEYNITSLDPCSNYEITVQVSDSSNSSQNLANSSINASTKNRAPGNVDNLKVVSQKRMLQIYWSEPVQYYYCVSTYIVKWRTDDGKVMAENLTLSTNFNITDIEACRTLTVEVYASNIDEDRSEPVESSGRTLTEVPGSVTNLNVVNQNRMLEVIWSEPTENIYCVSEYIVKWSTDNGNITENATTSTNYSITELDACVNLTVEVYAVNENGNRSTPEATNGRTLPEVTGAPESNSVRINKNFAVLQWYLPEDRQNACDLTSCSVNCVVTNPPNRPGLTNGTGFSTDFNNGFVTVNVTGLSPYTNYSCSGYVKNEAGNSESSEVFITTDEDVPPAPVIVECIDCIGNTTATITWNITEEDVPGQLLDFFVVAHFIEAKYNSCDGGSNQTCSANALDRSCILESLKPYSVYNITIIASTSAGQNSSITKEISTLPGVSEAVKNFSFMQDESDPDVDNLRVNLTWNIPCNTNGIVDGFLITYRGSKNADYYTQREYILPDRCDEYCEYTFPSLRPEYYYTVCIGIVVHDAVGILSTLEFTYPAGIPQLGPTTQLLKVDPLATKIPSQAQLIFQRELFGDNGGSVKWYEVIIAQTDIKQDRDRYYSVEEIPKMQAWKTAQTEETVHPYQTSPYKWNPFTSPTQNLTTFIIGSEDCSQNTDGYCNGPLKSETMYILKIRAFTSATIGGYQDSELITFTTGSEIAVGMIVGIIFAIIILGFLAILYVMYRRGSLNWPPKFLLGVKEATVRPQPILLKKFPSYCDQLLETPQRLSNEYQLLATLSADIVAVNTCVHAQMPENRKKNRYINILPYDATRVTLDLVDGDLTSHYINASFIKGYSDDIEYIATQGPKEETCEDFWRMVYQHDVRVIVMVTNLVEQDKIKCHQYFPNHRDHLVFEDMTVRCTMEILFPSHVARTLILIKGDRKRTISHLHFKEWPDFGVPQNTDCMLQFCQTMRHHAMAAELGLILVHCSAGVGRTGTLIAVDILLQHISENKKVDVFGTVFKLRKQRMNMVQTEGQYSYIYRCIKDAVMDPLIVNPRPVNNSLEPIYENVGISLNQLDHQYEKLPKWHKNGTNLKLNV